MPTVTISVDKSQHAGPFRRERQLNTDKLDDAIELLKTTIAKIEEELRPEREDGTTLPRGELYVRWHRHRAISVLGPRGVGKTSFVLSLLEEIRTKPDLAALIRPLSIVDPRFIKGRHRVLATVVSRVLDEVRRSNSSHYQSGRELPRGDRHDLTSDPDKILARLSEAIKLLASPTPPYIDDLPSTLVAERAIKDAGQGTDITEAVHALCDWAAQALGVRAFLLPIDDVDVAFDDGWNLLEVLRLYLLTPRLIPVLAGDLVMFDMDVTMAMWQELKPLVDMEKAVAGSSLERFRERVRQTSEQYLSKLLPPSHRIVLRPVRERLLAPYPPFDPLLTGGVLGEQKVPFTHLFARLSRDLFAFPSAIGKPTDEEPLALAPGSNTGVHLIPRTTRNFMRFVDMLINWLPELKPDAHEPSLDKLISLCYPAMFDRGVSGSHLRTLEAGRGLPELFKYIIERSVDVPDAASLTPPEDWGDQSGDGAMVPALVHGCFYRGCRAGRRFDMPLTFGIGAALPSLAVQDFRPGENDKRSRREYARDLIRTMAQSDPPSAVQLAGSFRAFITPTDASPLKNAPPGTSPTRVIITHAGMSVTPEVVDAPPAEPQEGEEAPQIGWLLGAYLINRSPDELYERATGDDPQVAGRDICQRLFAARLETQQGLFTLVDLLVGLSRIADLTKATDKATGPLSDDAANSAFLLRRTLEMELVWRTSEQTPGQRTQDRPPLDPLQPNAIAPVSERFAGWRSIVRTVAENDLGQAEVDPLYLPAWVIASTFEHLWRNLSMLEPGTPESAPAAWLGSFLNALLVHELIYRAGFDPRVQNKLSRAFNRTDDQVFTTNVGAARALCRRRITEDQALVDQGVPQEPRPHQTRTWPPLVNEDDERDEAPPPRPPERADEFWRRRFPTVSMLWMTCPLIFPLLSQRSQESIAALLDDVWEVQPVKGAVESPAGLLWQVIGELRPAVGLERKRRPRGGTEQQ